MTIIWSRRPLQSRIGFQETGREAVYIAKEALKESLEHHCNNGEIASYNSLGCAYGISSRGDEALKIFQKACQRLTPQTKAALRVDILSRIIRMYSNAGQDSLKHFYLKQMDETLRKSFPVNPKPVRIDKL